MRLKTLLLLTVGLFCGFHSFSQRRAPQQKTPVVATDAKKDTSEPKTPPKPAKGPQPYDKVITAKAVSQNGYISVHKIEDKYFFEIPDSILNRDILVVNRMSKAPAGPRTGFFGYGGDQIGKQVIQFAKGPEDKVFLKTISYSEISSDSTPDGMYRSLLNSNIQPLEAAFDIAAYSKDKKGVVIDMTKYISGDNDILFFDSRMKRSAGITSLQSDRSYIEWVKSFPMNVEIRTVKTYMRTAGSSGFGAPSSPQTASPAAPATYELNSSLVILPKVPMKPRFFDPRVGFFATSTTDFDANPQGVKRLSMAVRWRLEPKDEDIEKYKRGELVEPKKQIVYYIDPATPKKWVPYLIQGVNDWQKAFEQAGFKNAIVGKEAPLNDTTWSLDDARNSAIVYKPSSIANASGPNVNDPRSGEIIESHINWYHNVMELLRNWYFIQASINDPRAQSLTFSDELMGQLIRFVSSHEVGHTLGLRHNYGSSSTVPVEKLRDQKWLDKHGHTPSIMDYARFNYVAQPEDKITPTGLYPHIGEYDKWAIQWGYMWLPQFKTAEEERPFLNKMIIDSLTSNPRLFFGTESDPNDPRNQNEDLGDNAMLASAYGIKNLKRIVPNILKWTREANEDYTGAATIYKEVVSQFNRYMGHVSKNIGGIEWTPSVVETVGPVYKFTPRQTQKEAMQFLQAQLFTTPTWLVDRKLFSLIGFDQENALTGVQKAALGRLLNPRTLNNLIQFEMFDAPNAYTVSTFLTELKNGIWSELKTQKAIDVYRRDLQKAYVDQLVNLAKPPKAAAGQATQSRPGGQASIQDNDGIAQIKGHMRSLLAEVKAAIPAARDTHSRLHLQEVKERLENGLDPKI